MKLNPDCIRDILLAVEETTTFSKSFEYEKDKNVNPHLQNYTHDEIIYHINQCYLSDLVSGYKFFDCENEALVGYLTPAGHEFLANIRKDTVWQDTKDVASKVGSTSLSTLMQIAGAIITELIKVHIGIT